MAWDWLTKVGDLFTNGAIGKTIDGILDKIPDAGAKAQAKLEWEKERNRSVEYLANLASEENKIAQEQLTARAQADMASDSRLSKNIRPMTLAFMLIVTFVFCLLDSLNIGFTVKPAWIDFWSTLLMLVVSYYFVGRTVEKGIQIKSDANVEIKGNKQNETGSK